MSVIGFLKHYGLDSHFKLNIEPNHTTLAGHSYEHDIVMASAWDISNLPDICHLCPISTVTVKLYHLCCRTGLACWVQLTQTPAPQTWVGTLTSSPWTSGTPRWSWRRANCFDIIYLYFLRESKWFVFKANTAVVCYLVNVATTVELIIVFFGTLWGQQNTFGDYCLLHHALRAERKAIQC